MDILRLNLNKEPEAPSAADVRFQIALIAAVSATAAGLVARFIFDAPLVPEMLAQFIFAVAPIWVVEIAVGILGPFAKHLAFLACVVVYALALIAAAMSFLRLKDEDGSRIVSTGSATVLASAAFILTAFGVVPALGGGLAGGHLRQGALVTSISLLVVYTVYGISIALAARLYHRASIEGVTRNQLISRRRVIRGVGYTVLVVGAFDIGKQLFASWLQRGSGRVRNGNGSFPSVDNLALEITPVRDFYEVSKNAFDPEVDAKHWKLEVAGMVENPQSLDYDEIRKLPFVEQYATLACISNEVGGDLIGNALWRGVRLKDVLERAVLKQGVIDILLRATDDYTDSIPLDRAMADGTLLVYEMNGEPLAPVHGFPLRLLVPGIYGMKNVKWVKRIEAVDFDFKGYWQRRGWDDRAEYKTLSRIDAPASAVKGETTIAGIAFAGDRGISRVEVSVDGGKTWQQAEIKPALSQYSWVLWQKQWSPAESGKHRIVVRALDGRGVIQTSQVATPAPSGSSGYHSIVIRIG